MADHRQRLHDINLQQALASVSATKEALGASPPRRPDVGFKQHTDFSQATFYGTRKTQVIEITPGEPFGFAFEHDRVRYIVDFEEPGMMKDGSVFHKMAFNSSAVLGNLRQNLRAPGHN